ncbi:NAD(P)H-quinone oxidoreductase [Cellulomonas carbonis]|uniref:NADPH:quinone oxidoreductase n=1 Tax=Cellulomonas carbonis T26 TaxID=947969 RepID=A0A0A0BRY6_9CELL|nr:NAD(P)H-quinone oxidoreductase [Cellulomonas carbonis]KGM10706.1 NADPH:quinone oxidoreductase [Cellulomonas carbonis T26]GGC02871.1 NAD(P)H quinone oxidoreductase [Cellulomonas carbonis]
MFLVEISAPGGPEQLVLREAPDLRPGPGEVLLRVAAAGVNNADLLQRQGLYPPPDGAPAWPGLEVSGRVVALGAGVDDDVARAGAGGGAGPSTDDDGARWRPRVGDEVVALLDGGGYADQVVVRAEQVLPVPAGVDLVDAAALPEAACTVWSTLTAARLSPGEWLLVHGGSGGVGSFAVQYGAAVGASVVTTAGGPARTERCRTLGADVVVDHRSEDFVEAVRAATDGRGADVVLDVVGAAYLDRNLRSLATGGRLAVIGMQRGRRGELDLGLLLTRRATVLGTTLRSRPPAEKAAIVAGVARDVWPLVASGAIRPVVHERVPLADAARAHEALASGDVFGKVLLVP